MHLTTIIIGLGMIWLIIHLIRDEAKMNTSRSHWLGSIPRIIYAVITILLLGGLLIKALAY